MPYELNKRLAQEIGKYFWSVPIGNAMASQSWSSPGRVLGAMFSGKTDASPSALRTAASSGMSAPGEWEDLGKQIICKIPKIQKSAKMLQESYGKFVPMGLRCNEFAAAMIYYIKLNRNFESVAEIVRLGPSPNNCHYVIALDRDPNTSGAVGGEISSSKDDWGSQHILLDPWGAKQRCGVMKWITEGDATSVTGQGWFIAPREFHNKVFSICSWRLPQPRYIN